VIIDSHAHVFTHWAGPGGHPSREVRWKYIQKNLTRPSAKIRRARDGAPADAGALFRTGDNSWAGLRDDVAFRLGPYGRLEFTVDGEDYYIQYMPVGMAAIEAPPELMVAQMDYAGVQHCVLQAGHSYGRMNDLNALAQRHYPGRFTGLGHVDEPLADTPAEMAELERAVTRLGLRGLYYNLDSFARHGFRWHFDDPRFDDFWERVAGLDLPVFFEAPAVPDYDLASYVANMARLDRLVARFPATRWLLVIGPPVGFFAPRGDWGFPDPVARVLGRDNLWIEVCFPIGWGGTWDYPYPEAQRLIRGLRDRYGAGKLVWGSDMPNVERFCTYRQCRDYVARHCDFLSASERDLVLGGNVAELCRIDKTGVSG
jgi:predicted TIM-barrel fold metal-dependent hydrolase